MTHATGSLISRDGRTLFTRSWTPDGDPRGVVLIVHGLHEHSGRYAYAASALMQRGYAVCASDLRGHGRSDGPRGQVEGFDEYVDDLRLFLSRVEEEAGDRPVFLMGQSMGGLVVARLVASGGAAEVAGVALTSPILDVPEGTPGWLLSVADVLARWVPTLPVQSIDLSALSRDPSVEAAYKADPLAIVQGVRVRLAAEIRRAFLAVRDRPERFTMPLYLTHGTDDQITPPSGTTWLAEHAASNDVTLQLWPGLLHETFHEPERDETIAHFADWLDAHAPA
ncbi:alpha/beta hydrolase [Rubrivirga sp. IMCC43871]|uniref:alpha/beta hydrolase n=1 Tax=Rubrivirga sp. IMCC43871 TaxID=3391575 RepID=UPI0039901476